MLAQLGEGLLAVLLVVACEVLIGVLTLHGGKRTAFGDEIVAQALGYRKFLRRVTQSQLQSRLAQDSQYFYRILPYAEAMGLAGNLARTLGSTELEQCDWYQESSPCRARQQASMPVCAKRSRCWICRSGNKGKKKAARPTWAAPLSANSYYRQYGINIGLSHSGQETAGCAVRRRRQQRMK